MAKKTSEKMTEERRAGLQSFTILRHTGRISRVTQTIIETSLGFRASVGNQNMRKYKVGDRLLGNCRAAGSWRQLQKPASMS